MSGITLYEVVGAGREGGSFSPHVWKTKVDLGILGVDYTREKLSFALIESELRKEAKDPKLTVPSLKANGEYIKDSWVIAEWLDKKYASKGKSLFHGSEALKSFAKFIEIWADTIFANELRPLLGPPTFKLLDADSFQYKFKGDTAGVEAGRAKLSDKSFVDAQLASARSRLQVIENLLAYQKTQGSSWLAGSAPSHADALVFGWYGQSRTNPDVIKGVWEHPSLPLVGAWVKAVTAFIDEKELI